MSPACDLGPSLVTGAGAWEGSLPGLGRVKVDPDGAVIVAAAPREPGDPDTISQREQALRWGWGEPLSFARRGFMLLAGAVVTPPAGQPRDGRALLLISESGEHAGLTAGLCGSGWELVGDQPCPAKRAGAALLAYPRSAPLLVSATQARTIGWEGVPARGTSDAVWVDVARATAPAPISAIVFVAAARERCELLALTGTVKFEALSRIEVGRVLLADRGRSGPEDLAARLQLAAIPVVRLHPDRSQLERTRSTLLDWWQQGRLAQERDR